MCGGHGADHPREYRWSSDASHRVGLERETPTPEIPVSVEVGLSPVVPPPPRADRLDAASARPPHRECGDLHEEGPTYCGRQADRMTPTVDEPRLGVREDPRRTAQARSPGWRIRHTASPQAPRNPARADAVYRDDLAAVPAHASRDNAARRLLHVDWARRWSRTRNQTAPPAPVRSPPDHPAASLYQKRIKRRPLVGGLINEY